MSKKFKKANSFANDMAKIETWTLTAFKARMSKRFGAATLAKMDVSVVKPVLYNFAHDVTIQIEALIFGQKMPLEYKAAMLVPSNWWQHLVDDHFPEWYKKKFPVKHKTVVTTVTFNHWALLPKFNKIPPGEEIQMFTEPYYDTPKFPDNDPYNRTK